jgi:hypothetical protein
VLDLDLIESDGESEDEIEDLVTLVGEYSSWNLLMIPGYYSRDNHHHRIKADYINELDGSSAAERIGHADGDRVEWNIDWITVRSSSRNDLELIKPFVAIEAQQEKRAFGELSIAFLDSLRRHRIMARVPANPGA